MTPGESLVPWLLLLEQEAYRSNMKKVIKKILQTTDPYTTILKNPLQKTLDKVIAENQSPAIKKIEQFYIFFCVKWTE